MVDVTGDGINDVSLLTTPAQATINGAIFLTGSNAAGTGNFNTFLQVQNKPVESAFNSSGTVLDEGSSPNFNKPIKLSSIAITSQGGTPYYAFAVDANENNSDGNLPNKQLSLDTFKLYLSENGTISLADLQVLTPAFDLDNGGGANNVSLLFSDAFSSGSGNSDMVILVPVSALALPAGKTPADVYLYLYTEMGRADGSVATNGFTTQGNWTTDATFEEFSTQNAVVLHGIKFEDKDSSGAKNGNEGNLDGYTMSLYRDTNGDGLLDGGDQFISSTITANGGNYNFYGVATGQTYFIKETAGPAGVFYALTTGPYETVTVSTNATVGGTIQVADIGNHLLVPNFTIVKSITTVTGGVLGGVPSTAPTASVNNAGDIINYQIVLTNNGDLALTAPILADKLEDTLNATGFVLNGTIDKAGGDQDSDFEVGKPGHIRRATPSSKAISTPAAAVSLRA